MTPLQEIQRLDAHKSKNEAKQLKPRRERRKEARNRFKAAKLNQKKNDRLSA